MALYLTLKEIWRNKSRYLTFSLVIALITILVLFIAGLGEDWPPRTKNSSKKLMVSSSFSRKTLNFRPRPAGSPAPN
jgi:hypothetical protein